MLFGVLMLFSAGMEAGISITIKGVTNGASLTQSDTLNWIITGLSSGATVSNQIWIDLDSNGVINPLTDIPFVSFSQTDGVGGSNGPSDADGTANGTIITKMPGVIFPVGHYIFKTIAGTDSALATFTITAMVAPTFSVSGTVTKSGNGFPNIVVRAQSSSSGKSEYYGLTGAAGSYSITTNLASGTVVRVEVPTTDFNQSISGYVASPLTDTLTLTSNVTGINFTLASGKLITGYVRDTLGNPIVSMNVSVQTPNGSANYNGQTDITGYYSVAVPTGAYQVQFGNQDQTTEYVLTYYNQKYVQWLSDTIYVTSLTDTVKNINAVLRKGGVITGTVSNAGASGWNITAYQYGTSFGNALFSQGFNNSGTYYFTVLPGMYSIQFNKNDGFTQFYYNQSGVFPGTGVMVNAIGDTAKNINADFNAAITAVTGSKSLTPKEFALNQNYPNPFNPSTMISYQVPNSSHVNLRVFDVLGREVATLVNEVKSAGAYKAMFNASNFSSGVYFYQLNAGSFIQTKKMLLMK
jgi:hypothetical protein